MVKAKRWMDAKEFYTKAIAVLTDKSDPTGQQGEDPERDVKREKELEEQCFTNRALCHLELSMHDNAGFFWSYSADPVKRTIGRQRWIVLRPSG